MSLPPSDNNPHESDHNPENEQHDHDDEAEDEGPAAAELTLAIEQARVGLKSSVAHFIEALEEAQLYIPLAEDLPDAPLNEAMAFDGDLTFRPHMILNEDESIFAVAFSEPRFAEVMQGVMEWTTSDEDLKFICAPAHVAFELSGTVVDGVQVAGLVLNPGTDAELVLLRDEAASILQGVAIPLVGYVADLPPDDDGSTQVVEGADPPPPALLKALQAAKERISDLVDVAVSTTFNEERDREPHLTITLSVIARADLDRQELADQVMEHAADHVPAPGYADIVFIDAPN